MDDYNTFVPKVYFEQIPIKNLVSNQEYQGNLSMSHIRRTVENFDLYQINPVKVSRRNGVYYVFNDQHTIEIIATVSESRETPVWCMIYDDLEYTQEADGAVAGGAIWWFYSASIAGTARSQPIPKQKKGLPRS